METVILIVVIALIFFFIGAIGMAKHKTSQQPVQKPTPTRYTVYANQVINVAAMIYCNYSESKIIRPGVQNKNKQERVGEAIQESLNLVNAACNYFDLLDKEESENVKN